MQRGQKLTIETLAPGQKFYGTYSTVFSQPLKPGEDPKDYYFTLEDTLIRILEDNDLGVEVIVSSISGHLQETRLRFAYYGDPVDITSGAFTESMEALVVQGGTPLSVDFVYNSLSTEEKGDLGYGWTHDYEYHLEDECGTIRFYMSPSSYCYFVKEKALQYSYYGKVTGNSMMVAQGKEYSYGTYQCLSDEMKDYKLVKHEDDTYTVTAPNGLEYHFNREGKLTRLVDETGKSVSLEHNDGITTITEDISGKHLYLHYNGAGFITSVSDDNGRTIYIAYDSSDNIESITNVAGESVFCTYNSEHKLLSEYGPEGVVVMNEYDEKGRVIRQTDALGAEMTLEYSTDEKTGNTTVTVCDAGGTKTLTVDDDGQIFRSVNADGGVFSYAYDSDGNLVKFTDAGNLTTTMTYDSRGNVKTVNGI